MTPGLSVHVRSSSAAAGDPAPAPSRRCRRAPVFGCALAARASSRARLRRKGSRSRPSLQRPEIRGNRDEIRRRGGQRRHVDAGLVVLGIRDPVRARGGGVLQRAGGERRAASDMREIGRAPSLGRCPGNRVAHRAARVLDEVASPHAPAQWRVPWRAGAERRASARNRRARPRRRTAPCARAGSRRIPRIGPGRCPPSARNAIVDSRPGIRSFLPARLGTQKLWMTSSARRLISTGRPTGTWSSLAVAKVRAGSFGSYRASHQN